MREKLVCYLLGELDDAERAALEARLAAEPCLRKELEQIRACLESPSEDRGDTSSDCPEDLASRTARGISQLADSGARLRDGTVVIDAPASSSSRWSFVDVCVAAGVLLAVGAMLLPALPQSRSDARKIACQDNMRQLGKALLGYAENHHNYFPYIRPNENAGMFAVQLAESNQMSRQDLNRLLLCRASSLQDGSSKVMIVVPKSQQLEDARGQALAALRRWMAGSYAYRMGYVSNNRYYGIKNGESSRSPILSDAPMRVDGNWVSVNHGRQGGQNVLHQDGGVRFQLGCVCPSMDSNLFLNRSGRVAAGEGEADVVLGRSDATPGLAPNVEPVLPPFLRPRPAPQANALEYR